MDEWQTAAAALTRRHFDVAVVGAGPAGSIAALHLARRGRDVLLIDREAFPRDKVCGDGLIPDALAVLERAGLLDTVAAKSFVAERTVAFSPSRIDVAVRARSLVIKRFVFDALLAEAAARAGATSCRGDVVEVLPGEPARLRLRGGGELTADVAVLATGANVALLERLGMVERARASAIAARCYVRSPARVDDLILSFDKSIIPGYAWIFPLPDGEYNVGCGFFYRGNAAPVNLRDTFAAFTREFPLARRIVDAATEITPLKGAMLRCGLTGAATFKSPNVLAIGETIGATYPFSGEGIGKAMETGEIAADVIARGRLADFDAEVQKLAPKYAGYKAAENWLSHAWLNDFVARRARHSKYLMSALEGIIAETADPREIFSVRGVWRSLWR